MKPFSLTGRLTLWFTLSSFFLIAIVTISLYWSLARTLDNEDGRLLADRAQTVIHLIEGDPHLDSIKERVEKEWTEKRLERVYVKVLSPAGKVLTETPGFENLSEDLFRGILPEGFPTREKRPLRAISVEGRLFKILSIKASPPACYPGDCLLQIAIERTTAENFLVDYRSRILLILFLATFVSAFVGRRIAIRGIRPVEEIAARVKKVRSTNLHERIDLRGVPTELESLVGTFNEMLDRLNDSFERLSQFSQDIAHDLRTPINNLRGELEVSLGRLRTPTEYHDVLGSCLEECVRLSKLIESLLFIARAENPKDELAIEAVNLSAETGRIREFFEASAAEAGVQLEIDIPGDIVLFLDRQLLQRALANLIQNSLIHTPKSGWIRVSAVREKHSVRIAVADTGIGIPETHLPKVFDRFYRIDPSRSAKSGSSGLGLAIVKGIMNLHRGQIEITSVLGQGTEVRLYFPLA